MLNFLWYFQKSQWEILYFWTCTLTFAWKYSFSSIICQVKGEGKVTFPLLSNYVEFPFIFSKIHGGNSVCFDFSFKYGVLTVSVLLSIILISSDYFWSDYIWCDYFWCDYMLYLIWLYLICANKRTFLKWKEIISLLTYVWCHRIIDNLWMWHHQNQ